MALKQEPIDIDDEEQTFHQNDSQDSAEHWPPCSETADSTPSAPANFLIKHRPCEEEVVLDPMQEDVVYLPQGVAQEKEHRPAKARQKMTQYANYTISHCEEEVNSKKLPKKYRCRLCVYKTSYKSDLNRHLRKHGVALQHCPICNMPFKTTGNLENHIRQSHINVMDTISIMPPSIPAVCVNMANQQFPGIVDRRSPKNRKLDTQLEQLDEDFSEQSPKEFCPVELPCHVCPFICTDAQVLARHILSHPAEGECQRSLETDGTSTRHICDCCGMMLSDEEVERHRYTCEKFKKAQECEKLLSVVRSACRESDARQRASPESTKSDSLLRLTTAKKLRLSRPSFYEKDLSDLQSGGEKFSEDESSKLSGCLSHKPADTPQTKILSSNRTQQRPYSTQMKNAGGSVERLFIKMRPAESSVSNRWQHVPNPGEETLTDYSGKPKQTSFPHCHATYSTYHEEQQQANERMATPEEVFAHDAIKVKEEPQSPDVSIDFRTNTVESNTIYEENSKSLLTIATPVEDSISGDDRNSFSRNDSYNLKCDLCKRTLNNMTYLFMHLQLFHSDVTKMTSAQVSQLEGRHVSDDRGDHDISPDVYQREFLNLPTVNTAPFPEVSQTVSLTTPASAVMGPETQRSHSQSRVSERKTPDNGFRESRTSPETAPGRYARLVSDFEEFAAKPYACSLCFFRTSGLSELSAHVQNHLTGCSSTQGTASFHTGDLSHVEHAKPFVKVEHAGSPLTVRLTKTTNCD